MMKLFILILFSFALITLTNGCKKYDKGPAISLRTAKTRLVNDWVTEPKRLIDCILVYNNGIEFFEDNTFNYKLDGQGGYTGTWKFEDNETVIALTLYSGYTKQWRITKLTNKKLWVIQECTHHHTGDTEHEYQFIPVK